ncbi:adenylate/guanylate cyclase domain-containing protein [Phyllobacterium lublinensis]|uniref:adenylate/guanylate cyclase domain-containing protein n=1 Tax=Phyllobacterium lublinensis TaxID=2875708 RepID=UPI001CCE5C75|nr:adenylate/guanylate cyclase domain-containing protein [Phyllobacterium sp. 2063]MBZ9653659.1 adenylate/guanylate cyclase domain-containing protein [Phyllobacterium sp. 2063]
MGTMEAPPLERKLVAIFAADVEGYSRLMHEDEERTLATLSSQRAIIDGIIAGLRGEISGTAGDSVLAEFASVVDALHCAISIQQSLNAANKDLSSDARMLWRIGVNVGDVMVKDGGIFGDGVNVASRLEALAEPGGICVTRGVRDHLRDRTGYEFEDLGEHSVKNIARPVRIFRVIFDPEGSADPGPPHISPPKETIQLAETTGDQIDDSKDVELVFWQSVQESNDPAEYEAYLAQFPDGDFTALARTRLAKMLNTKSVSPEDSAVELEFWNSIKDSQISAPFEAYLQKYPDGEFGSLAAIRLKQLTS